MSGLFDKTTNGLAAAINMRLIKHNVGSSNIANAETPGYHAKRMDFEDALGRALDIEGTGKMRHSNSSHFLTGGSAINRVRPDIYDNPEGVTSNDGNTVDLETEMAGLAENQIMYKAALQLINKKLAALKYAATDGGR